MSHNPLAIANTFLEIAEASHRNVTPMQLQKLVYIAHGYHLGLTSEPLIAESVEAWRFGPVVPSVYQEFARFGSSAITAMATNAWGTVSPVETQGIRRLIEKVWAEYSPYSGWVLSNLTHRDGTPWTTTVTDPSNAGIYKPIIPDDRIREYYAKVMLSSA